MGGAIENTPIDVIRNIYETNYFGAIALMQSVITLMHEFGHDVTVNISSAELWETHPGAAAYASSKWALEGLPQALAAEL